MPKFSAESFTKLSTCHIDLQVLFFEIIKNVDCMILVGHRNEIEQEEAFRKGYSKLHFPHGKHNSIPSMALDACLYPPDLPSIKQSHFFGGYVLGISQKLKEEGKMSHSVRWGGSWDGLGKLDTDNELADYDHFELIE